MMLALRTPTVGAGACCADEVGAAIEQLRKMRDESGRRSAIVGIFRDQWSEVMG